MGEGENLLTYAAVVGIASRKLRLEETPAGGRLVWPSAPAWVVWTGIAFTLCAGVMNFLAVVWIGKALYDIGAMLPPGFRSAVLNKDLLAGLGMRVLIGVVYLGWAAILMVDHLKYGDVARMLEVGPAGVVYTRRKLLRVRSRRWALADVRGADVRMLKSLIPGARVGVLRVETLGWWTLRFRLKGATEVDLGQRFLALLCKEMGGTGRDFCGTIEKL